VKGDLKKAIEQYNKLARTKIGGLHPRRSFTWRLATRSSVAPTRAKCTSE
jgi:hypothetical protein